ncbi:bacterial Ig-like domain-containing protein [Lactiplantibacillus plantarum]|uniref:bacterial Ig-like domain-containing protein n=1 Tax=Lactiplantibacillus plantarum TaxID=1590 RepID=UPI003F53DE77
MNRFITSKQHYKMYKKGRFWVFAGITVATFTLNPLISRADTETTTAATAATTTAGASSSSNSQVLRTTTTSTTGATTQSSATAINAATTNTSAQKKQAVSGTTTDSKTEQPVTAVGENENETSNLSTSDSASASSQAKTGSGDSLDQTSNSSVSVASSSQKVTTQNSDYQNDQGTGSESGIQSNVTDTVVADESLQTNRSSVASPSTSTMASIGDSDSKDSNETEKVVDSETSPIAVTATTNTITTTNDKVQLNRALLARAAIPATVVSTGTLGTSAWQYTDDGVLTIHAGDWTGVGDVSDVPGDFGSELTKVVIDGPINAGTDTSYMFRYNPNLASIDGLENLDTSKVTDFSMMFMGTKIADFSGLAHWNVSSGTSFDSMFASDSRVQSYDLSQWQLNTVQPVSLKRMFSFNTALTSIDLSTWNVRMVTDIDGLFNGDKSLTTADLHGWNLLNVTALSSMFLNDTNLTDLDITGWQTGSTLTSTKFMFEGTPGLKAINIASLDMSNFAAVTEADMNKEPADHDMFLNQDSSGNPLPMNLNALTVGSKTYLVGSSLPDIPTGTGYTGKWVNQADATQTYTSSELMALYNGVDNPADTITWVWETSPSYADFTSKNVTGLIAGPKTTWRVADSVATLKDVNGTDIYATADTVVKVISVNGDTAVTTVDTQTAGTYQVDLQYTDAYGKVWQQTSTVAVAVNQGKLVGKPLAIKMGAKPTYTINDLIDTDNSRNAAGDKLSADELATATVTGLDTSKAGAQTVTLAYTDDATGMVHTTTTTVTMVATKADLTMRNSTIIKGPKNSSWDYRQYVTSVTDFDGNPVSLDGLNIVVDQQPDLTQIGSQTVTLTYTDALGNVISVPKAIGPQTVTLTYTDAYGNQTTDSTTVTVDFATITGQATHPIAGPTATWDYRDSVTQVIDTNGKTIDVDTADITATTPDLTPAKTGKPQTVTLTYTDSLGKVHTTDVIVTTALSKAKITAVADQIIWPDQAKQLTATDLVDRLYDAEGHLITNYDNVEMSALDSKLAGQQRLTLTYTDVAGNQSVAYANVTVDQAKLVTKPSTVIAGPTATWSYEAGISQLTNAAGQLITVQPGTIKVLNRPDLNVDSVGQQQLITLIYTDELGKSQSVTAMVTAEVSQATLTAKAAVIVQPDAAAKLTANDLVTSLTDASGQAVTDYQIVQMSKLDATRPGVQPVSLTYTDAAGNEVSTVVKVTVDQAKMESQNRTQIWGPSMTWDYRQQLATVTDSQGHQLNPDQAKITVITGPQLTAKMIDKPQTVTLMYTDDLQQTHTVSAILTLTASQAALVPRPAQIVWAKDAGQLTPANFLQTITGADGTQVSSLTNVKMSAVNASQPGAQTVTLTYTDDYGNEVTTTAQVTVDQAALTTQTARPVAGPTAHWDYQTNFKTVTNAAGEVINVGDANIKVLTGPDLSTGMVGRPQVVTFSYTDELGLTQTTTAEVTTVASRAHMTTSADQVIWPAAVGKLTVADLVTGLTDAWGQTSQNYQNVTMTTINAQQAGKQQVTLTYTDEVGNVKTATTTVTVDQAALTTQPQMVIAGPTAKWDYHQGIGTITDGMGQPIAVNNAAITVVAMPDLTVAHIGQPQTVQLVYTDSLGQQQTALIQVTTVATQAKISTRPVTVIAGPKTTWSLNDSVDWSTSLAADGTLLTAAQRQRVTVDGTLNLRRAGNYPLTLSYMDRAGNLITVTTSIDVLASQAQLQVRDSQLTVGNTWAAQDNFERATDAQGQALTLADIAVDGTVNTQRTGRYTLTYHYIDVAGNQLTKTAVVTVVLPDDDHINTTDPDNNDHGGTTVPDNNDHGETSNPDGNDHAGIADPSETPKPSERPNDSDGHTVDWGVDDRITTKQQPAAATRAQTKVKTTAEPALPANNEHTSAAKAAATPVTRVTDTTADTLPQTGERDRSAQQGAVVLGLTGLLGLMGLGRRRHTHED